MRYPSFLPFLLLFTLSCTDSADSRQAVRDRLTTGIDRLRSEFAPDGRTDRIVIDFGDGDGSDCASWAAYTTVPAVVPRLDSLLAREAGDCPGLPTTILLPDPADSLPAYGLIRVSVANVRTHPGHSQELTSQALLGTPVRILDRQDHWYLIRTPDRYIAWLEEGAVAPVSWLEMRRWYGESLRRYLLPAGSVTAQPGGGKQLREIVAGALVQTTGQQQGDQAEVRLPDGTTGWLSTAALAPYLEWAEPRRLLRSDLLATASTLSGRPYLWGGTSGKAMDCSGFTKMSYYLNGFVIPRDASQQVHAGKEILLTSGVSELEPGDLLFFGTLREDGSQRITHVGISLGGYRFLHAGADNGYITENSLLESDPDFAPERKATLLRAKRLQPGDRGVLTFAQALNQLQ